MRNDRTQNSAVVAASPLLDDEHTGLATLVRRFRVCWDCRPEYSFVDSERQQIGFSLDLRGVPQGNDYDLPAGACARRALAALKKIADYLLADGAEPVTVAIFHDQAIHFPQARNNRAEVILTIQIYHGGSMRDPVNEHQVRFLGRMKHRLMKLGAYEGRYHRSTTARTARDN